MAPFSNSDSITETFILRKPLVATPDRHHDLAADETLPPRRAPLPMHRDGPPIAHDNVEGLAFDFDCFGGLHDALASNDRLYSATSRRVVKQTSKFSSRALTLHAFIEQDYVRQTVADLEVFEFSLETLVMIRNQLFGSPTPVGQFIIVIAIDEYVFDQAALRNQMSETQADVLVEVGRVNDRAISLSDSGLRIAARQPKRLRDVIRRMSKSFIHTNLICGDDLARFVRFRRIRGFTSTSRPDQKREHDLALILRHIVVFALKTGQAVAPPSFNDLWPIVENYEGFVAVLQDVAQDVDLDDVVGAFILVRPHVETIVADAHFKQPLFGLFPIRLVASRHDEDFEVVFLVQRQPEHFLSRQFHHPGEPDGGFDWLIIHHSIVKRDPILWIALQVDETMLNVCQRTVDVENYCANGSHRKRGSSKFSLNTYMRTCFICQHDISPSNGRHIYHCAKINEIELSRDEIRKRQIDHTFGLLDEETFRHHYEDECWSLPDFRREMGYDFKTTQFLCAYFGVKSRTMTESQNERTREKRKQTNLSRHGVENPSQSQEIKGKKKNTFLKNYGVDNVFKAQSFKDWLPGYMQETYGKGSLPNRFGNMNKWWDQQSPEYRKEASERQREVARNWWASLSPEDRCEHVRKISAHRVEASCSKIELLVGEALGRLGIDFTSQHWVAQRSFDYRIANTNLIIEVNGDYWHANPLVYAADDLVSLPEGKVPARQIWDRDNEKRLLAENYGYAVMYLWEMDIRENLAHLDEWLLIQMGEIAVTKNGS